MPPKQKKDQSNIQHKRPSPSKQKKDQEGRKIPSRCTTFCKTTFLKERERVETAFAEEHGMSYVPVDKMKSTFGKNLKAMYVNSCKTIYCNKGCNGTNKDFINSVEKNKQRKENLQKQGAISACRDLVKEFPKYYKSKTI